MQEYNEAYICNLALSQIGEERVSQEMLEKVWNGEDLSSVPPVTKTCALLYDQAREEALKSAPYGFASNTVYVDAEESVSDLVHGYGAYYKIPSDCLQIRDTSLKHWKVEGDYIRAARIGLWAGPIRSRLRITYTRNVRNVAMFDVSFRNALASLLASKIAPTIANRLDLAQGLKQVYDSERESVALHDFWQNRQRDPWREILRRGRRH